MDGIERVEINQEAKAIPLQAIESAAPRPFHLPGLVLTAGFCLAAAGACFDYHFLFPWIEIQNWHVAYCCAWIAALLATDRERVPYRMTLTLGAWGLTLMLAYVMRQHVAGLPLRMDIPSYRVAELLTYSPAIYLWGAALWLAAPVLLGGAKDRRYARALQVAGWALMIYGAFCLASAASSQDPDRSLRLFYKERAVTFAVLFAWLRAVHDAPRLRAATGRCVVMLLAALMLLGTVAGLADLAGPEPLRAKLAAMNDAEHKLIHVENAPQTEKTIPERRLQFPMLHFNRTAYLALVALMVFFVAAFPARVRTGLERWILLGLAPAFFVMVLSYTRGVTAAAVAGLCLWAMLVSRRALIVIVIGCVVVAAILPASRREHYLSIFKPSTYEASEGGMTSMKLRIMGWKYGRGIVRQMPLTGLGYGTRIVLADYQRYVRASGNQRLINDIEENANLQHMHNLWLEIAVESGLPALLAFIAFTLTRWWMLGRTLARARGPLRQRLAAWLAFELSLMIAGTIYYMLKHNFGMINFFVWGFMMSELAALGGAVPCQIEREHKNTI